jgi:RND family efflux transporter MFP subunit
MKRTAIGIVIGIVIASAAFVLWNRLPAVEPAQEPDASHSSHGAPQPPLPADAAVQLTAEEQRQARVQTAAVEQRSITDRITAAGRVEEPETAIRTISARVGGRIDRLLVNFTGQPVRNGQPVAEIYSPEIVTAAEEYKLALENRRHLAASQQAVALQQADALIAASRRRLELWGLTEEQIETLISAPETPIHITIASSAAGIIRTRQVTEGQYVNAGDALFDVIDLSTVWVEADVFQTDIGRIRPGLRAEITSDALAGTALTGTVSFIEAQSDVQSRTTPVRIEVRNPGMRLRPGMFVNARFCPGRAADRGYRYGNRKDRLCGTPGWHLSAARHSDRHSRRGLLPRSRRVVGRRSGCHSRRIPDRFPNAPDRRNDRDVRRLLVIQRSRGNSACCNPPNHVQD